MAKDEIKPPAPTPAVDHLTAQEQALRAGQARTPAEAELRRARDEADRGNERLREQREEEQKLSLKDQKRREMEQEKPNLTEVSLRGVLESRYLDAAERAGTSLEEARDLARRRAAQMVGKEA